MNGDAIDLKPRDFLAITTADTFPETVFYKIKSITTQYGKVNVVIQYYNTEMEIVLGSNSFVSFRRKTNNS